MAGVQSVQPSKPEEIEFPEARDVAFFGDWHGNLHFAKKAIESLPGHVEVAVHTGDFGYMFADDYLNAVNKSARRKNIVVMFVDGNHECVSEDTRAVTVCADSARECGTFHEDFGGSGWD